MRCACVCETNLDIRGGACTGTRSGLLVEVAPLDREGEEDGVVDEDIRTRRVHRVHGRNVTVHDGNGALRRGIGKVLNTTTTTNTKTRQKERR